MMLRSLIMWFMAFPLAAMGQGEEPNIVSYWQDSMNIRIHATNMISNVGNLTVRKWDSVKGRYVSIIPDLLQYKAMAGKGYTKVRITAIGADGQAILEKGDPGHMAGYLDSILAKAKIADTISLIYDNDGYLLQVVKSEDHPDKKYYIRDTSSFTYELLAKGGKRITWRTGRLQHEDVAGYSSIYCGTINKGPLDQRSNSCLIYDFDRNNLMIRSENNYKIFANKCKDYVPSHHIKRLVYDQAGRPVLLTDLLANDSPPKVAHFTTYTYNDTPLTSSLTPPWSNANYKVLQLPLVAKWLREKQGLNISVQQTKATHYELYDYSARKFVIKDTPKIDEESERIVWDGNKTMLLTMNNSAYPIVLYQYGHDSAGTFRGSYTLAYMPEPDTFTYNPNEKRVVRELGEAGGDFRQQYLEPRKGAILARQMDYSTRNVKSSADGWRLVTYNRLYSGADWAYEKEFYWIPKPTRFRMPMPLSSDFVITGPDGLVHYIYNSGRLMLVAYSR